MIYAGYVAGIRRMPATITPIGICVSPPFWFKGCNEKRLAPSHDLLKSYKSGDTSYLDYWNRYYADTLDKLNVDQVYKELSEKGSTDVALCCYEHPELFCHRHIISHWFATTSGHRVIEWGNNPLVFGG